MAVTMLSYLLFACLFLRLSVSSSTTTEEICRTRNGASSISSIPTTTYTRSTTSSVTVQLTTTPAYTVTPTPYSTTVTVTSFSTITVASTTGTITQTDSSEVFVTSTGEIEQFNYVNLHMYPGGRADSLLEIPVWAGLSRLSQLSHPGLQLMRCGIRNHKFHGLRHHYSNNHGTYSYNYGPDLSWFHLSQPRTYSDAHTTNSSCPI